MNIAILYQVKEPPQVGNIRKPMKEGGYSDSGSDLAYELKKNGYNLITPVENHGEKNNIDWVFGDDDEGITKAINMGADVLWLNTVLYDGHPIEKYIGKVKVIGQKCSDVQTYDDKIGRRIQRRFSVCYKADTRQRQSRRICYRKQRTVG